MKKLHDDFIWDSYSEDYYEREMVDVLQSRDGLDMIIENSEVKNCEAIFKDNLHPNWCELYHQVVKLGVSSVFECGTGCGHHLINIKKLCPSIEINGCDYSKKQIDLGYKHFNLREYDFSDRLFVKDFTEDLDTGDIQPHEFVFTQAVTMHLAYEKAKKFIRNMGSVSSKYVFLIENITAHDYPSLFEEVLPEFERIHDSKYLDTGFLLKRKNV